MFRKSLYFLMAASACAIGLQTSSARAEVPKLLVYEGETLPVEGTVSSVNSPQTNGIGGWCIIMTADDGGGSVNRVWGSVDGVAAASTLRVEGMYDGYDQTSIQTTIDLDDAGNVIYRSQTTTTEPTIFIGDNALIEEETIIPTGPLAGLTWDFISNQQLSFNGTPYFIARVKHPTQYEHLMRGTDFQVLLSSNDLLPGMPAILDNDSSSIESWYGISGKGTDYIAEVTMDTSDPNVGFSDDSAMVLSGNALYIDRSIVRETFPIPASIGGLPDENWDNFDFYEVNEFGQIFLTGDSDASSSNDEFIYYDGQIVLREGDVLPEGAVSSSIGHADMNEQGDWVAFWTVGGVESLILNGEVVTQVGDTIDEDGDGIPDTAVIDDIPALTSLSLGTLELSNRDANGDVTIYSKVRVDGLNGNDNVECIVAVKVTPTQAQAGDVEVRIDDALDPLTDIPAGILYHVRVRNRTATPVGLTTVTATIDSTLTGVSTSVPSNETAPNVFEVSYAGLAGYETKVFAVTGTASTGGLKNSSASISVAGDPNAANDSDTEETFVGLISDLAIDITDSPDPLNQLGGLITYTVSVTNNGLSDAPDVNVVMNLDPTTTYVSSDPVAVHNSGQITADITGAAGLNGPLPAGQTFDFNVTVQVSTQGTLSVDASVTTSATDPDMSNNSTTEDTEFVLESDLRILIDDNTDFIAPGNQIVYSVQVENQGPSDATGVVADIILDADTTLFSVDLPGMPNGANVQANIGNMAANSSVNFTITVDTNTDRYLKARATVTGSGTETDPDTSDNTQDSVTAVYASALGSPRVILSTINGHPTALAPGMGGREFDSIQQPFPSPDGKNWVMVGDMDGSTSDDSVLIRSVNGVIDIVAQEGVTLDDLGDPFGTIDNQASINDNGDYALTTNHDPNTFSPMSNTEIAVKSVGGVQTTVIRQGDVNLDTFQAYYFDIRSPLIQSNGTIWVYALTGADGPPPNYDLNVTGRDIYDDDAVSGGNVQFRALPSSGYPINGTSSGGFFFSSLDRYELTVREDESQYFINGIADDGNTTKDVAAIGTTDAAPGAAITAVVEEGVALPGLASPVASITSDNNGVVNAMMPNGDWYVRGSNDDGSDWVYSNGVVIAKTGDELFPGAGETYDDNGYSAGFFTMCGNGNSDFVIGSRTDCLDTAARNVLVLNNERVIMRSNDPVDLDGNGVYDDDVFINTFGNNDQFLTDGGILYFVANLKTGSGSSLGAALLSLNTNCDSPGDLNDDGHIDGLDVGAFVQCQLAGNPPSSGCACADMNGDGSVDDMDTPIFTSLLVNLP